MNIRRLTTALFVTAFSCICMAQPRSEQEATAIAKDFLSSSSATHRAGSGNDIQLKQVSPEAIRQQVCQQSATTRTAPTQDIGFYVFNDEANHRFVIVSGDKRQYETLGYSEDGIFPAENIPCCMAFMLREYMREFDYLSQKSVYPLGAETESESSVRRAPAYKNCILDTRWGQYAPYNNLCNGNLAGCVAVAMAQIMYKHKYPSSYSWSNMLKTYKTNSYTTTQANAVAKLIRDCGVNVHMDYGTDGSSAKSSDAAWALAHKFGYNPNIKYYKRNYFSQNEWEQIILEELKAERPILYSGKSDNSDHAFILDGYDGNGFYHFNWGWNGSGVNPNYGNESYFKLTSLTPKVTTTHDYTYDQNMVCQISPETVGNFECVFYADKFTASDFTLGNSFKVSFENLKCYVTSANSFDSPFKGQVGIGLYHAFTGNGKLWCDDISMKSGHYFEKKDYSFTISSNAIADGTYYLYPCVITGVSNGVVQNRTVIRTLNTQYDYYLAKVKNGKVTLTLKGTPTPEISIASVTCENTNLNKLTLDDKLVLNAKFKNMGAKHTLKSRLSICTKNSEGKLSSKYKSTELSKQIAYNEEVSFKHELSLSNITPGTYYATIMYYKDWADAPNWYYPTSSSYQYEIKVSEGGVEITKENFPDTNLRNILLQTDLGKDGILTKSEIKGITTLTVPSRNISSLSGIEYFTELSVLDCHDNQLTALDVSKNTKLTTLYCFSNKLTTLDVSKNTELTELYCPFNKLTALDVSKNTKLTVLHCINNQLTALNVSKAVNLKELSCAYNKIKGSAMDALINSLPMNASTGSYDFNVIYFSENFDENVCTKAQVTAAKAKGWTPKYYDGSDWVEYEGSDDTTGIKDVTADSIEKDTPIYNIRGQRLDAPRKGINIINGKLRVIK